MDYSLQETQEMQVRHDTPENDSHNRNTQSREWRINKNVRINTFEQNIFQK